MTKFYERISFLVLFLIAFLNSYSQITWSKNSGALGAGNFTISGNGSVSTINADADIAFLKHGTGTGIYYTCNNCTINIQISGQLIIDYPLYLISSRIIIGSSDFSGVSATASLFVNGNTLNPKQAIFLDNASSIQLESPTNFITLQSSPAAYLYFNYPGEANSIPSANANHFAGTDNAPLCGLNGPDGANSYTCDKGQANGPSLLNAGGFSIISSLPVVLVDFSANLNSNQTIGLSWSTQVQVNLSHFTIYRSADGANWAPIGMVQASGNSGIVIDYSFTDLSPLNGLNYYRLQMTDLDNKSGFTQIILLRTPIFKAYKVFPNPAWDYVDITLSKTPNGSIRLFNQYGQVLQQKQVSASNSGTTLSFQLYSYPAGNYIVQLTGADGSIETGKLVIVR